jgi:hypothetical protein
LLNQNSRIMKRLIYLSGLILFLLDLSSVSCKKEKPDDNENKKLIVGMWDCVSIKVTEYENNVVTTEETFPLSPGTSGMEFLAGGTGKTYSNDTLNGTFDWEFKGDLLVVTYDDGWIDECEITVNESTLTLKVTDEVTFEGVIYKNVTYFVWNRI